MQSVTNKLMLFGGIDSLNNVFKETWFFDETNGFVQGPDLPAAPRKGGMSCSNAFKFYYNSGYTTAGKVKETWMLDILAGINEKQIENAALNIWPNPA